MHKFILVLLLALSQWPIPATAMAAGDDAHDITTVMKQQFDRPDAPLVVNPVTVVGSYAVASWTQAGKGGRALLQRDKDRWVISVCGGDGLTRADVLQTTGMGADGAQKLAKAITAAEAKLGADKRKLFASFEGMVKVDAAADHAQHGQHGAYVAPGKP
jgi:hypothetical protein